MCVVAVLGLGDHSSADYWYVVSQVLQSSFDDALQHVADPTHYAVPVADLLCKKRAANKMAALLNDRLYTCASCLILAIITLIISE